MTPTTTPTARTRGEFRGAQDRREEHATTMWYKKAGDSGAPFSAPPTNFSNVLVQLRAESR